MKDKILPLFNIVKNKTAQFWPSVSWPARAVLILAIFAGASLIIFWLIANQEIKTDILNSLAAGKAKIIKAVAPQEKIPANYIRRHLDGVYVDPKEADYYSVAVMIDNDPDGRPQAGLARANIVYEAKAEAGITRYLAIFAGGQNLANIGPVRSARPYYIDWAQGYNALYVHVGGSPEALARLRQQPLINLNEFYQGSYFWRANDYAAPHNVFTSFANINQYLDKMNLKNSDYDSWLYKPSPPDPLSPEARGNVSITINFSVPNFLVQWQYDKAKNEYARYLAGAAHKDSDGAPITAKNIVIMKVAARVLDSELRRQMDTVGAGKAWYCLDGVCEMGKWRKENKQSREKIYGEGGEEVKFNAGTTWIEVIQQEGELSIK